MSLDDDLSPKRLRSPPYPFIGLGKAVERAKQLYPKALHHPVGMAVLADAWGYAQASSGLVQTAAALIQFGLMVDEGSGPKRRFQLTKEAIRIVQDADPDSEKRRELLKAAALAPKIHRELWERFGAASLSDMVIRNYLMFDRADTGESPFGAEAAGNVINEYKTTIGYASIDQDGLPDPLQQPVEEETRTKTVEHSFGPEHSDRRSPNARNRSALKAGMKEDVFSLKEGDVVLQWPERLSSESYADLEDWAAIILRKIKRNITQERLENEEGSVP